MQENLFPDKLVYYNVSDVTDDPEMAEALKEARILQLARLLCVGSDFVVVKGRLFVFQIQAKFTDAFDFIDAASAAGRGKDFRVSRL